MEIDAATCTETDDPDPKLWAVWMHRKGNVHDFAITNGKGPRLHHFAYWVPTAMNILHLCDVMASSGFLKNLERGPGRHGISNAFFLYVRDPDGHRLELYTSDYFTGDHDHEPMRWSLSARIFGLSYREPPMKRHDGRSSRALSCSKPAVRRRKLFSPAWSASKPSRK